MTVQRKIKVVDLDECALKPGHPKWEKVGWSGRVWGNEAGAGGPALPHYEIHPPINQPIN